MPNSSLTEFDELRLLYQEIVEGCSPCGAYFVKHFSELEQIEIVRKRADFIAKYVGLGIPREEERLKSIMESGEWSEEKEGDILAYRMTIIDNEKMVNTVIPIQQAAVRKAIEEHRKHLAQLLFEKRMALGTTAEELAEKDNSYFLAYLALYQDRACKNRLFLKWEDFEALSEAQQEQYQRSIDAVFVRFTDLAIRKISALPFFLNPFSYCKEAIYTFVNKPMCELTNFQIHLFSLGSRNMNILSQAEGNPPEYLEKTPAEEVIKWYDLQYSIIVGKRKQALNS